MEKRRTTVTYYKLRKFTVNVKANDSVDIKCGGPRFLGFDFWVDAEENPEKVAKWIDKQLAKYGLPCIHVGWGNPVEKTKESIWTYERMEKEIANNYRM